MRQPHYRVTLGSKRATHEAIIRDTMIEAVHWLAENWPGVGDEAASIDFFPCDDETQPDKHKEVLVLDLRGVYA